jgi:hypothetical protein
MMRTKCSSDSYRQLLRGLIGSAVIRAGTVPCCFRQCSDITVQSEVGLFVRFFPARLLHFRRHWHLLVSLSRCYY